MRIDAINTNPVQKIKMPEKINKHSEEKIQSDEQKNQKTTEKEIMKNFGIGQNIDYTA